MTRSKPLSTESPHNLCLRFFWCCSICNWVKLAKLKRFCFFSPNQPNLSYFNQRTKAHENARKPPWLPRALFGLSPAESKGTTRKTKARAWSGACVFPSVPRKNGLQPPIWPAGPLFCSRPFGCARKRTKAHENARKRTKESVVKTLRICDFVENIHWAPTSNENAPFRLKSTKSQKNFPISAFSPCLSQFDSISSILSQFAQQQQIKVFLSRGRARAQEGLKRLSPVGPAPAPAPAPAPTPPPCPCPCSCPCPD